MREKSVLHGTRSVWPIYQNRRRNIKKTAIKKAKIHEKRPIYTSRIRHVRLEFICISCHEVSITSAKLWGMCYISPIMCYIAKRPKTYAKRHPSARLEWDMCFKLWGVYHISQLICYIPKTAKNIWKVPHTRNGHRHMKSTPHKRPTYVLPTNRVSEVSSTKRERDPSARLEWDMCFKLYVLPTNRVSEVSSTKRDLLQRPIYIYI